MKPEEKARVLIDQMFADAGWKVVSRDDYSPNLSCFPHWDTQFSSLLR